MLGAALLLLLLLGRAAAQEDALGAHIFDTHTAHVHEGDAGRGVVGLAHLSTTALLSATSRGVRRLQHDSLLLVEEPMTVAWDWRPSDPEARLVAGPVLHAKGGEFFVADAQARVYAVAVADGTTKWTAQLDADPGGGGVRIGADPAGGNLVAASAGDQLMVFRVDTGGVAFHRRVGPATVTSDVQFVVPAPESDYTAKIVFGDSQGVVHALDVHSGRKAWTWKFPTAATSALGVVDLVRREVSPGGRRVPGNADTLVAVSRTGDIVAILGSTGTLLWRSQVFEGDQDTRMVGRGGSAMLDEGRTLLVMSNDHARGAMVHRVDLRTGRVRVFTMVSGPGLQISGGGGISVDRTIPLVFVVAGGTVRVYNPKQPLVPADELRVGGFPTTRMSLAHNVSELCTFYLGTTSGNLAFVGFESMNAKAPVCNFAGSEAEDLKDDLTGEHGTRGPNDAPIEDVSELVEGQPDTGEGQAAQTRQEEADAARARATAKSDADFERLHYQNEPPTIEMEVGPDGDAADGNWLADPDDEDAVPAPEEKESPTAAEDAAPKPEEFFDEFKLEDDAALPCLTEDEYPAPVRMEGAPPQGTDLGYE